MRLFLIALVGFTAPVMGASDSESAHVAPDVEVRRPALWVPDLDRAIVFYRDVLGFTVAGVGELTPKEDSVLLGLFNATAGRTYRRALFSTGSKDNALFIMESEDGPRYAEDQPRPSALIIKTNDLDGVIRRARQHGFRIGNTNVETSMSNGQDLRETTVIGPAGHAALMYQFIEPTE